MKKLSILKYVLLGVSFLTVLLFFVGATDVDLMLEWAYVLLGVAVVLTIVFPVLNIINNPQGTKRSMIGLAIVVVVLGLAFMLGSDVPVPNSAGGQFDDPLLLKLSDTGLYATYAAMVAAIVAAVAGEISNIFK